MERFFDTTQVARVLRTSLAIERSHHRYIAIVKVSQMLLSVGIPVSPDERRYYTYSVNNGITSLHVSMLIHGAIQ